MVSGEIPPRPKAHPISVELGDDELEIVVKRRALSRE
mgnify:CR=1 FL=1